MHPLRTFAVRSLAAFFVFVIVAPTSAGAVLQYQNLSGTSCVIENDDTVEANVGILVGEYQNNDSTNDAHFDCNIPLGPGWEANDLDGATAYVYDGSDDQGVSGTLNWHGTGSGTWDGCGTRTSNVGGTGNTTLNWTGLDVAGSCADYSTGSVFMTITLPDLDVGTSSLISLWIKHTVP